MIGAKGRKVSTPQGEGVVAWSKGTVFLVKLYSGKDRMFMLSEITFLP